MNTVDWPKVSARMDKPNLIINWNGRYRYARDYVTGEIAVWVFGRKKKPMWFNQNEAIRGLRKIITTL